MSRRATLLRVVRRATILAVALGWALTLRPQMLGGPATYLVIRGTSMLPIYDTGDLVILHDAPGYGTGEVVGYRVPAGELGAGRIVLHRIIGERSGTLVLQGDNNRAPDPWTPSVGDVAGRVWIVVPGVGRVIAWAHEPAVAASLATGLIVAVMIGRSPAKPRTRVQASLGKVPGATA